MAATGVRVGEAQARRHSATGPHDEIAPEAPRPRQAALTAEGSSLIPGSRQPPQQRDVPEAGDGQTPYATGALFAAGGNMLNARALDVPAGEDSSMRVVFTVPGLAGGVVLDLGDASEPVEFTSLGGSVEHEYPALSAGASSVVYDAVCRDEHGRLRGWIRFRLPHHRTAGQDLRAGHPASTIV